MLNETKVWKWMGKSMGEIDDWVELDRQANRWLSELLKMREKSDDNKIRSKEILDRLEEIDKDEKNSRMFFDRIKLDKKKEEIEMLEERIEGEDGEEKCMERRDGKGTGRVIRSFYEELWSKRRISRRQQEKLIGQIIIQLDEEKRKSCEGEITTEEIKKIKMKLTRKKSSGVDGIPAEFWQKFEFLDEWLEKFLQK